MAYEVIKGERPPTTARKTKYPFSDLEVGDCFAAPRERRGSLSNCAVAQGRRLSRKFIVRNHDAETVRVWRIA